MSSSANIPYKTQEEKPFSYGRNWDEFVKHALNEERLQDARESLLAFLDKEQYEGKTFIDIGCGSGIFSLGAYRLGSKVISVDMDPKSVETTKKVKEKYASSDADWEVVEGDILNPDFVEKLRERGDIVYSWGVLMTTGDMYQAIENTTSLVKPGGHMVIAVYNRTPYSPMWVKIKRFYNNSPKFIKKAMLYPFYVYKLILRVLALVFQGKIFKLPPRKWFGVRRGMSLYYDAIDWLGGDPYEYASVEEIRKFGEEKLGLKLVDVPTKLPSKLKNPLDWLTPVAHTGNNEFVFRKPTNDR